MTVKERAHGLVLFLSDADEYHWPSLVTQAIKDAVKEEREACAELADNEADERRGQQDFHAASSAECIAAAIRSRK